MGDLAAVVLRPDAEQAIDALRGEGIYDDTRSVVDGGDGTVELPVTAPPTTYAPAAVVEQADPVPRLRGLDDRLRQRGWTDAEVEQAPRSWGVVGDVVLVRLPDDCPDPEAVGAALLELHGAETVLAQGAVSGPTREPDVSVLAGTGTTEVVHVEHGTRYALDLASVMFSPGNQAERVRMGEVVDPGERVLDAFAGIGYFALPMARAGADVTAIEINPVAFGYLVENAVLNGVEDRLSATLGDCRDVVGPDGPGAATPATADRIVLGHFDAPDYLDALVDVLSPGGVVHLHAAIPADGSAAAGPAATLEAVAARRGRSVEGRDVRQVKSYAPGVEHVVVDARLDQSP